MFDCIPPYAFIIDTNEYAGSFQRELTAYCTGKYGDCNVGENMADLFKDDGIECDFFDDHIMVAPDEHGCNRPTEIWLEPTNQQFNSVAIFMDMPPDQTAVEIITTRAKEFFKDERVHKLDRYLGEKVEILGFRLVKLDLSVVEHRNWKA